MTRTSRFCTFYLDSHCFGVDMEWVQEVVAGREVTRVPLAPAAIHGLINLRGKLVTALNLRYLLGFPTKPNGHPEMNVVICSDEGIVSFVVDEIGDVVVVDENSFEPLPESVHGPGSELVRGTYRLSGRMLRALDCGKTVSASKVQSCSE